MPAKYRAGIKMECKEEEKSPGRQGEKDVNDCDSVVDFFCNDSNYRRFKVA